MRGGRRRRRTTPQLGCLIKAAVFIISLVTWSRYKALAPIRLHSDTLSGILFGILFEILFGILFEILGVSWRFWAILEDYEGLN